jgi:hypothetical protein
MKFLNHKYSWLGIGLFLVDLLLFSLTNATNVPSFLLIVGFIAMVVTIYFISFGLLKLASIYGIRIKRRRRSALYISALVGGLLALQSIDELSWHDTLVWLPLLLLAYLYSSYAKANRHNLEN